MCVLNYYQRVATQLQLNIYHIISYIISLGHVLCKFLGNEYSFSKVGLSSGFALGIFHKTFLTDVETVVLYQKIRELLNACVHA